MQGLQVDVLFCEIEGSSRGFCYICHHLVDRFTAFGVLFPLVSCVLAMLFFFFFRSRFTVWNTKTESTMYLLDELAVLDYHIMLRSSLLIRS